MLGGPAAKEDVELKPAALAAAVDDATLARGQVGRHRGAGLGRAQMLGAPRGGAERAG